ncbi:MAG: hypothetical protein ACFB9M_11385 [Myxococcota bacterium]
MRRFGLLLLFISSPVFAQNASVTVNLSPEANILATELGVSTSELEALIVEQVEALYGITDIERFLELSANAQNLTSKGLGVDYASDRRGIIVGVAASGALDAGDADIDDLENIDFTNFDRAVPLGVGAQLSVMVGYNFRRQGLERLTVYTNGLYTSYGVDEFDGRFTNFGLHGQYKVFGPYGPSLARWGGIDVSSGVEFSRMVLTLKDDELVRDTTIVNEVGDAPLTTVGGGELSLLQTAWTIPLEVTTNVQLAYFFSLYGGFAGDIQFGNAELRADTDVALSSGSLDVGTADVFADDSNGPTTAIFRLLGGVQFNIWKFKIFGQVNLTTANFAVAGAAGLRFVE